MVNRRGRGRTCCRCGPPQELLDDVDTSVVFRQRAAVMRIVPHFLRSSFRNAMKLVLEEATWGNHRMDASTGKRMENLHSLQVVG